MLHKDKKYHLNYDALKNLMEEKKITQAEISKSTRIDKAIISKNFRDSERIVGDRMRDVIGYDAVKKLNDFLINKTKHLHIDKDIILYFLYVLVNESEVGSYVRVNLYIALMAYKNAKINKNKYNKAEFIDIYTGDEDEDYNTFKHICVEYINQVEALNMDNPEFNEEYIYGSLKRLCMSHFNLIAAPGNTGFINDDEGDKLAFKELCKKYFKLENAVDAYDKETLESNKEEIFKSLRNMCMQCFNLVPVDNNIGFVNENEKEKNEFKKGCKNYFKLEENMKVKYRHNANSTIDNTKNHIFFQVIDRKMHPIPKKARTHAKQLYYRCLFGYIAERLNVEELKYFISQLEKSGDQNLKREYVKKAIAEEKARYTIDNDVAVSYETVYILANKFECSEEYLVGQSDHPKWCYDPLNYTVQMLFPVISYDLDARAEKAIKKMYNECRPYAEEISDIFVNASNTKQKKLLEALKKANEEINNG